MFWEGRRLWLAYATEVLITAEAVEKGIPLILSFPVFIFIDPSPKYI